MVEAQPLCTAPCPTIPNQHSRSSLIRARLDYINPLLMRLLRFADNGEFSLVEFVGENTPRYAILSHTWGADNKEVTFKDLMEGIGKRKVGYSKIHFYRK